MVKASRKSCSPSLSRPSIVATQPNVLTVSATAESCSECSSCSGLSCLDHRHPSVPTATKWSPSTNGRGPAQAWANFLEGLAIVALIGFLPALRSALAPEAADPVNGEPISDIDVRERRPVAVLGHDVASKLFDDVWLGIGKRVRIAGSDFVVKGIIAPKGTVLGQSWDGFVMLPFSSFEAIYGRRRTTVIAVKMPEAAQVSDAMARAEEAMRVAHRLRPGQGDDFTIDTAEGLIAFWQNLTKILFRVLPAVVAIGIVVGGIVIMNIMLMTVNERTREIGIRKSLGARRRDILRQFLAESVTLACLGVAGGTAFAALIRLASPLPARITWWSVGVALTLGATVGLAFGVYPASRAARLDPITALRQE